jgi:thiamine-monophosphate kinase
VNLREFGEAALIRKIRENFQTKEYVTIGIGDDAAVFDLPPGYSAVFCSDLVAENAHFIRNLHPPDSIGYKAVAVNVSDVGAMGGVPMHFLISLALPGDLDVAWVDRFLGGVERACTDFGVSLVGGDSSSSDRIFVDVSMIGRVPIGRTVRRSGAQAGDNVYITGTLGGSALGFELLKTGNTSDAAVKRHLFPQPRHRVGAAAADRAHAMIDVSDGLSTDLGHILDESGVSARIYKDRIPAAAGARDDHVLHGGEEYELIIVGPELPSEIESVSVTRIGEIIASPLDHQLFLIDGTKESILSAKGWQHFS